MRSGDTLQSIAQNLWGDSSLWYELASANGLSSPGSPGEGRILAIPANVMSNAHSASTFRPYDPAKAIGDLSPTNPKPSKKAGGGCGMLGQIIMMVVAVAVTAWIAPWATGLIAANVAGIGAVGAAVVGGAIAGAVGSIASQAVGIGIGAQSGFNWKGVGLAAIAGGISGGLAKFGALAQAGKVGASVTKVAGSVTKSMSALGKIGSFLGGTGFVSGAARGLLSNVLGQGIGVATGLQDKFDWAGVAGAALGGGVSSWVSGRLGPLARTEFDGHMVGALSSAASAVANAGARTLIDGTDFGDNLLAALPDVIGGTIGNMIAGGFSAGGGNESSVEKEPQSEEEAIAAYADKLGTPRDRLQALLGVPVENASLEIQEQVPGDYRAYLGTSDPRRQIGGGGDYGGAGASGDSGSPWDPRNPANWSPYRIQNGDTLGGIVGLRRGLSTLDLAMLNRISSEDDIRPNRIIMLPDQDYIDAGHRARTSIMRLSMYFDYLQRTGQSIPNNVNLALPTRVSTAAAIWGLRNSTGLMREAYAEIIAERSTHRAPGLNRVVLGKWEPDRDRGYIGEARRNGGTWFETSDDTSSAITAGLSRRQGNQLLWEVNKAFLNQQMRAGVTRFEFVGETTSSVLALHSGSFRAFEIRHLDGVSYQYGYRKIGNSWVRR